jgi:hypothetical protein
VGFGDVSRVQRHRDLEDRLRNINRNGRILHDGLLLPKRGLSRGSQLWHRDAVQVVGGVHFINQAVVPSRSLSPTLDIQDNRMGKSRFAAAVDEIQAELRPFLRDRGFKLRGRTFNRVTEDGLTQVVSIQMGSSDPPGTTYIPGLRENLQGLFTINLGVYVPEVARHHGGGEAKSWVREYKCCVRARLGEVSAEAKDFWWHARFEDAVVRDVRNQLEVIGLPFLDRFSTRDKILAEWRDRSENMGASNPPRIVMAIILVERDQKTRARELLAQQVRETRNPGHPHYVRQLAEKLSIGRLDV